MKTTTRRPFIQVMTLSCISKSHDGKMQLICHSSCFEFLLLSRNIFLHNHSVINLTCTQSDSSMILMLEHKSQIMTDLANVQYLVLTIFNVFVILECSLTFINIELKHDNIYWWEITVKQSNILSTLICAHTSSK